MRRVREGFQALWRRPSGKDKESFQVAASAREYTRRTRDVLDDKLTFAALLVRAGEVNAAGRLLQDLQRDVHLQGAALAEAVNEVRARRAAHDGCVRRSP